jgi:hypothetical protein
MNETLVSFDVVALYSSISHDLALQICSAYISADVEFETRAKISVRNFLSLLRFCLINTYFVFNNTFYRQIKGLPMGASISVTVANIVMEHLETTVFKSHPDITVRFFKRYIDDLVCALQKVLVDSLLSALNSYDSDIQFTVEYESDNKLPYLDTLIMRQNDGSLRFSVYRKPTHSGRYLSFHSNNPISHKKSVGSSLFHRALTICSDTTLYKIEKDIIIKDLRSNDYPLDFINRIEKDVINKRKLKSLNNCDNTLPSDSQTPRHRVCLPYLKGWSEVIGRICNQFELELTHRPINKLRFVWGNHKSILPAHKNMNAIYQIDCSDCNMTYTGESNNSARRLKEHEADFRLERVVNSALASHLISNNHRPNFDSHRILANDNFYRTRKFMESYFIQDCPTSINKHPGSLPSTYLTSELFKLF